jgi:hypothetical protein
MVEEEKRKYLIQTLISSVCLTAINNEENNFRVEIVLWKKHDAFYRIGNYGCDFMTYSYMVQ